MATAIAFAVVSSVIQAGISYLFPSEGPRLTDLKVSASTYGNAVPNVFGTCRVAGNMIWCNPIREEKKKKSGKGGGYYNEYTYYADFAMAFCTGPVTNLRRVWADNKLIYDSTGASEVKAGKRMRMRFYAGDEEQLPDALIEASKGVGNTPAYRGLSYVVFENFALANFGNRIPQMQAEVFVSDLGSEDTTFGAVTRYGTDPVKMTNILDRTYHDFDRGYIYRQGRNPDTSEAGIVRYNAATGVPDRYVYSSEMGFSANGSDAFYYLLAVLGDGSLIVQNYGLANYTPIHRLDPYSFQITATIGEADAYTGEWSTATAQCCANGNYYCHIGDVFDECALFYGPTLQFLAKGTVSGVVAGTGTGTGSPDFYIIANAPGAVIDLWRATTLLPGMEPYQKIDSITPSDLGLTSLTGFQALGITWDASEFGCIVSLICDTKFYLFKWSLDTQSVIWTTEIPNTGGQIGDCLITTGEFAFTDGERYYAINTVNGEYIDRDADSSADWQNAEVDPSDFNDGSEGLPLEIDVGLHFQTYNSTRGLLYTGGGPGGAAIISVDGLVGGVTSLGAIVEALLRKGGMTLKDFDLTPLYDIVVRGYGWAAGTDIKSIIDELRRLYLFDLVESGGRLVAVMRSDAVDFEAVSATVPQAVLGSSSDDASDYWKETRLSEADLPERVTLVYMNIDNDFETSAATTKRMSGPIPTMYSKQQVALELNVVMTATEAKNQANKILYAQWGERTKHETSLPWAYLNLDPADRINVVMDDGRQFYERINTMEVGANFAISLESYGIDSGAYVSDVQADGGGSGRSQTLTLAGPAVPFILNTPLLRDTDDTGGGFSRYYTGMGSDAPGAYGGATMFRSINNEDYDSLYSEPLSVEWGSVAGTVPPPTHGTFGLDWETQITIYPATDNFELESITDAELWEGLNLCVIGEEVIQFRDAEENEDGSWTISNLLRGRRGSEYACETHGSAERFVFLDTLTIELQGDLIDARGQARYFKAVGAERTLSEATPVTVTYEPRDLMPYAVGDIRREFALSSGDLDVSWSRRTRLGGNMQDGTGDVPLQEQLERYEVYLLAEPFDGDYSRGYAPAEYVRMFTVDIPQISYTPVMQAVDGFDANLDTLHVVIYQLSGAVGRGFPAARSIEPWRDF